MLNFTPLELAMAYCRELRRQAEVERLVDQVAERKHFQLWGTLRKKLGEGLVTLGERLARQTHPSSLHPLGRHPLKPALARSQRNDFPQKPRWIQRTQVNSSMSSLLSSNLYSHQRNGHPQANKPRIERRGASLKAVSGDDEALRPWKHPLPP